MTVPDNTSLTVWLVVGDRFSLGQRLHIGLTVSSIFTGLSRWVVDENYIRSPEPPPEASVCPSPA